MCYHCLESRTLLLDFGGCLTSRLIATLHLPYKHYRNFLPAIHCAPSAQTGKLFFDAPAVIFFFFCVKTHRKIVNRRHRYPQKSTFSILSDSSGKKNAADGEGGDGGGGSGGGGRGQANFAGGRNADDSRRGGSKAAVDAEEAFLGGHDGEQRSPGSSAEEAARAQVGQGGWLAWMVPRAEMLLPLSVPCRGTRQTCSLCQLRCALRTFTGRCNRLNPPCEELL